MNSYQIKQRMSVLLMIGRVYSNGKDLTVLYDSGANISLISKDAAKNLKLQGKDITLSLTKVGNVTEIVESKEYTVPITDLSGKIWNISVCEMEEVTSDADSVKPDSLSALFLEYNNCDQAERLTY